MAADLQMQRAPDAEHLLCAWQNRRILVSRDLDFLELHTAWMKWPPSRGLQHPPEHAGILLIPSDWSVPQAAHELDLLIQSGRHLTN
jgi:hypothetical protein